MTLSATALRNAKPSAKPYKMADGGGLYLLVKPSGGMYWRLDYRFNGKRKTLALGTYPDVKLKLARERRDEARALIADGIDPSVCRKAEKANQSNTFEAIAREWFEGRKGDWAVSHAERIWSRLERFIFPYLGDRPIDGITAPDVLTVLRRIEERGTVETAHRMRTITGQVFRYAQATGRASTDPTAALRGALKPFKDRHLAAVTDPDRLAEILRMIDGYGGEPTVAAALRIAPYVFVRPGELRGMKWADLDFDAQEWRFTASKTGTAHVVPLADQVIAALRELEPLTGRSDYVFKSLRGERPISDMALGAALRRLGIDTRTEQTIHGFRATARTLLHEQLGYQPDVIEHQLAHKVPDRLGNAYNRTRFLEDRRKMMQHYADYLDGLKRGNVIPMKGRA